LAEILPRLEVEIVKRSDHAEGFVVLPKRWIVERTIAWLNRCRRLAKDWENLNRKGLAFLRLASIGLMTLRAVRGKLKAEVFHSRTERPARMALETCYDVPRTRRSRPS
jgi:Transposase DDE domain